MVCSNMLQLIDMIFLNTVCFNALKLFFVGTTITMCASKKAVDLNSFPNGFLIGTASSSYQIEGAWNVDGKLDFSCNIYSFISN